MHARSRRHAGPFVPVNAGALASGVFESELFGHVRGAFTGAIGDRVGCFELAESGTLFLVEIEDDGPGLPSEANLFVPFFTTKPQGSGIGLVLARAIAENHGGSVELFARSLSPGCIARVIVPLDGEASAKRATTRTSLPRAARAR